MLDIGLKPVSEKHGYMLVYTLTDCKIQKGDFDRLNIATCQKFFG